MQKREMVEREKQQAKLYFHVRESDGGGGNRKETGKIVFIKEIVL